jgi:hypothetical protein
MSNEHAIALILGIFIPGMLLYVFLDRTYQNRLDAVATGFVSGVQVSAKCRELLLYSRLLPFILVVVSPLVFCGIGMMLLARTVPDADVRLLAYIAVFLNACGAAGWLLIGFAQVLYFRSVLRQAKAD